MPQPRGTRGKGKEIRSRSGFFCRPQSLHSGLVADRIDLTSRDESKPTAVGVRAMPGVRRGTIAQRCDC